MPLWLDEAPPQSDYRQSNIKSVSEDAAALYLLSLFAAFLLGYWIGGM